jgi:hypothetical protein
MSKRRIGIAAAVLMLLIAGAAWALRPRSDAQVEKIKQMQDEMLASGRPPRPEDFDRMRRETAQLSDAQRRQVGEHMRDNMQRRMEKQIDDYFALPPQKRTAYLDKQIQDEEKRRKEREARRAQDAGNRSRNPQNGQGQSANAGGGRNANPNARSEGRNRRLDGTSPDQRAKQAAYRAAMQQRRIALGLPPGPGRPGGR